MSDPIRVMYSWFRREVVAARMRDAGNGFLQAKREPEIVTEDALHAVAEYLREKNPDALSIMVPVAFRDGTTGTLTLKMNREADQ